MTFGERLKKLRTEKGLTLKDLSLKFNKSKTTFSNYENNYRKPNFDLTKKLADYFGVSIDYLLDYENSYVKEGYLNNIKELAIVPVIKNISTKPVIDERNIVGYKKVSHEKVKGGDYFYYLVQDNSLINAGIHKEDNVLVKKQSEVNNGDIAVVMVNKEKTILRKVYFEESKVILLADGFNEEPLIVNKDDVELIGKAVEVVHRL